ncbi:hypothetical protein [Hymenobacter fodinae]|uniref:Uncharacterized protein n=1 Tax=Hymenobacter fodinae TaxID=2510796 RepID=A0A4Z0P0Z1_9BACT|nr:hypothetical protein [Hymenobacter fodinae]TGE03334.1 hypothetical protein EU556_25805 [Hymenobacter fodinae]
MKNSQSENPCLSLASLIEHAEQQINSGYDARCGQLILRRMRANYARLYALYQQLSQAAEEGIYEVTVRSASQVITLQVGPRETGSTIGQALEDEVTEELRRLNKNILHQLQDQELEFARAGTYEGDPVPCAIHALCLPQPESEPTALQPAA